MAHHREKWVAGAVAALGDSLRYIYTDERATLGHYVEHVWMAPDLLAQMRAVVPTYPPVKD